MAYAPPTGPMATNIAPAYRVRPNTEDWTKEITSFGKDGKMVKKSVPIKGGFIVEFPRGHSIRVENEEALEKLGFSLDGTPLVDMEEGDVVGKL